MKASKSMQIRRRVARAITRRVRARGLTQSAAGARMGISQPRVNGIVRGHLELYSLDALVDLGGKIGVHVQVSIK